jgi:phosphatidylserine/phosphatidylglycerophosphate/cardiolipin synthase-like enzyme
MRVRVKENGLTVQAVAGTYVVLLGLDLPERSCRGLRGFGIHRTDHTENESAWMQGQKTFAATDPGLPPGAKFSTRQQPIQGFTWSDFSAKPGHDYTYRVVALKGDPADLQEFAEASVRVQTESPESGTHDIYFNRGVAASQEFTRRFGNKRPDELGAPAFKWLSRGLFEAMTGFIDKAKKGDGLRVSAYELGYEPVLEAFKRASERGVDVRIVYDRRRDVPGKDNDEKIDKVGIRDLCTPRTKNTSSISHNKFIVYLRRNKDPVSVLTGGTNFSRGGIFGHSNCMHIVEEKEVAAAYLDYWTMLSEDPESKSLRPRVSEAFPVPAAEPPEGTITVFSPRSNLEALDWYVARAAEAKEGLFMTFAFGMNEKFQEVYATSSAPMRYALLEQATRPMGAGPERDAEEAKIAALRQLPANRFAIGAHLTGSKFENWLNEQLSGLNKNVRYIHTKYMLIDPLGPDPLLVAGSANFSVASTTSNDENMLIIRGNKRVADIYLGEFMRLYNHYAFREWAATQKNADARATPNHLRLDDWWRDYFGDTERARQREYFVSGDAGPAAAGARRLTVRGKAKEEPVERRTPARRTSRRPSAR